MENQIRTKKVFAKPLHKDKVTVLRTNEETGGSYSPGELEVAPGGVTPLHTHGAFEEPFTITRGTLVVTLKRKKYYLHPGDSITVPLKTPRYFFHNGKKPITCHIKFVPGHEDFIKGLSIAYGLAADGKTTKKGLPKSLTHRALLMILTDTKPPGIHGMLFPLFRWLAKRAKKNGTEEALLEKYYYE